MATATLHLDDVGGWPGPAKCWKLDPPKDFGGWTAEYAVTVITQEYSHQNAECFAVPATASGAGADPSRTVRKRGGSLTLHDDPYCASDPEEYMNGAHFLVLAGLGYTATGAAPDLPAD